MDIGLILYYAHLGIDSEIKKTKSRTYKDKQYKLKQLQEYKLELVKEEIHFLRKKR